MWAVRSTISGSLMSSLVTFLLCSASASTEKQNLHHAHEIMVMYRALYFVLYRY